MLEAFQRLSCLGVTCTPVSHPSKLTDSQRRMGESFPWPVVGALAGAKRHLFVSPLGRH